jgi:hypothetical protein
MGGGPSLMYAADALAALEQFLVKKDWSGLSRHVLVFVRGNRALKRQTPALTSPS